MGLDPDIVKTLLTANRDADKVSEEIDFFRNLGVSGVPTFIYNGQFAVTGAQPKSVHLDAIKQAVALPVPAPS
jgi:predicted DsbA family dithiol-disulfide isomerase